MAESKFLAKVTQTKSDTSVFLNIQSQFPIFQILKTTQRNQCKLWLRNLQVIPSQGQNIVNKRCVHLHKDRICGHVLANGNGEVAKRFSPKQIAIRDAVGLDKLWAAINMRALSLPFSFSLSLSPFPLSFSLHSKKNQVPGNLSSVKRQARASTRRVHEGGRSGACGHGEGKGGARKMPRRRSSSCCTCCSDTTWMRKHKDSHMRTRSGQGRAGLGLWWWWWATATAAAHRPRYSTDAHKLEHNSPVPSLTESSLTLSWRAN